jgi:hypothetical protein
MNAKKIKDEDVVDILKEIISRGYPICVRAEDGEVYDGQVEGVEENGQIITLVLNPQVITLILNA